MGVLTTQTDQALHPAGFGQLLGWQPALVPGRLMVFQPGEGSAVCMLPSQSIAGIPADKPLADFVPMEITGSP